MFSWKSCNTTKTNVWLFIGYRIYWSESSSCNIYVVISFLLKYNVHKDTQNFINLMHTYVNYHKIDLICIICNKSHKTISVLFKFKNQLVTIYVHSTFFFFCLIWHMLVKSKIAERWLIYQRELLRKWPDLLVFYTREHCSRISSA